MTESKIETIKITSIYLNKIMPVSVYLPCDYNEKDSFPTLYFLHGRSGDENILIESGLNISADKLIGNREINSMIIVCPRIENSRGINSSSICKEVNDPLGRIINIGMYEDYLINEVIPTIDKNFKTIKNRKGRYIGGASAGGYVALHSAFRHSDLFSKTGGHMPAIELQLEEEDKLYFQNPGDWDKYNPIYIASNMERSDIKIYLDAGDKDEGEFYKGCSALHEILTEKGMNSQNYIFKGNHNIKYIKSNIEKYLRFYANKIKSQSQHSR